MAYTYLIEKPTGEILEFAHQIAATYDGDVRPSDTSRRFCRRTTPTLLTQRAYFDDFNRGVFQLRVVDMALDPHIGSLLDWTNRTSRLLQGLGEGAINGFEAEVQGLITVQRGISYDQWVPALLTEQPAA